MELAPWSWGRPARPLPEPEGGAAVHYVALVEQHRLRVSGGSAVPAEEGPSAAAEDGEWGPGDDAQHDAAPDEPANDTPSSAPLGEKRDAG